MNNFKPGDDAWFFNFPEDGCGGFDVGQVNLYVIRNLSLNNLERGFICYAYKSREAAIVAMIEKITNKFKEY